MTRSETSRCEPPGTAAVVLDQSNVLAELGERAPEDGDPPLPLDVGERDARQMDERRPAPARCPGDVHAVGGRGGREFRFHGRRVARPRLIPGSRSRMHPGHDVVAFPGAYATGVTTRTRSPQNVVPWLVDTAIALGLTALSVLAVARGAEDAGGRDPLSVALLLLETLPLVVRRRWPIPVSASRSGRPSSTRTSPTTGVNESLGALVALFTVADRYDRRLSLVAAIVTAAAFGAVIFAKLGLTASLQA